MKNVVLFVVVLMFFSFVSSEYSPDLENPISGDAIAEDPEVSDRMLLEKELKEAKELSSGMGELGAYLEALGSCIESEGSIDDLENSCSSCEVSKCSSYFENERCVYLFEDGEKASKKCDVISEVYEAIYWECEAGVVFLDSCFEGDVAQKKAFSEPDDVKEKIELVSKSSEECNVINSRLVQSGNGFDLEIVGTRNCAGKPWSGMFYDQDVFNDDELLMVGGKFNTRGKYTGSFEIAGDSFNEVESEVYFKVIGGPKSNVVPFFR